MLESEYTKVFEGNFIVVQLVLDRLQSVGINAIVKDESESGRLAGFGSSIQGFQELFVSNEELNEALPIVDAVNSELQA